MTKRMLRGVILAGALMLADGCTTASGPSAAPSPGKPSPGRPSATAARPSGPFPGLRYSGSGTATLTTAPAPASTALPGANDLLAADEAGGGSVLLAATDSGIWRSADSGTTWRRVLPGIAARSLTRLPGGGYAAFGAVPGPVAGEDESPVPGAEPTAPAGNSSGVTPPELATSADGVSWHLAKVRAHVPDSEQFGYQYRLALEGTSPSSAGVAVPDPAVAAPEDGEPPYRTVDGGRRWTPMTAPGPSESDGPKSAVDGGVAVRPDGNALFITAAGTGTGCMGAVYESRDGGAKWTLLPGSCQAYPLQDVQFTSDLDGFAVGGKPAKFDGGQVVEATTDGGLTWHVLYRTGSPGPVVPDVPPGFVRIDMLASGDQGWAIAGGCTTGQNGPCPGRVYVTDDGGAQWRSTGQTALSVAGLGDGGAAAADSTTAAVTSDGGTSWTKQAPPTTTTTKAFAGSGSYQFWTTNRGTYASTDGGKRWAPAPALPSPFAGQAGNWQAAALGGNGTAYAVSGPGTAGNCLSPDASVLYTSSDGGSRWNSSSRKLPFGISPEAAMAASGRRVAVIDACGRIELSTDAGEHWRGGQSLGSPVPDCTMSMLSSQLWFSCQIVGPGGDATWSLRSADGGAAWQAYRLPAPLSQIPGIYATGPGSAVIPVGGSLWRTADDGRSWTQSWVLPRR